MLILYKTIKRHIISHMKEVFIAGMVIFMTAFIPTVINSADRYDENGLTLSVIGFLILSALLASGFVFSMTQAIKEVKKPKDGIQHYSPESSKRRKLNLYQRFVLWLYILALSLYRKSGLD